MFIVPASKQNRLKPHRGGMVRSGEGHAALTGFEKMIAQGRPRSCKATVGCVRFGKERRNGRRWPFHASGDPQHHVIGMLGLLPVVKSTQLEHQQRPNP